MEEILKEFPNSIEAEQAVLGCIINNKDKLQEVNDILTVNDFYFDRHKKLFNSIKELVARDVNVDLITLLEELRQQKNIENCGGITYITSISTDVIFKNNVLDYANIVKDKANRRSLIDTGRNLIAKSYEESELSSVIDYVEENMYKLSNSKESGDIVGIEKAIEEALTQIEDNYNNGGKILGKTTGFTDIDKTLSGLQKGDFIVVAARPSMGKTAFALNIGQYASKAASVAMFSLEMTRKQLMERLISAKCLVKLDSIKTGKLDDEQFKKIALHTNDLAKRKIFIDDKSTNLSDIKAKCRLIKSKQGLDVVIIDYLQLIELTEGSYSREQEIAKISRELKKLAKKLEVTVVALSQLSRAPEQRVDHRPILSDLRESGSIEQDADIIMMLYRNEYYNKESGDKNIAEVIVNKNRNGEVKTIKLGWLGQFQRFAPLERVN